MASLCSTCRIHIIVSVTILVYCQQGSKIDCGKTKTTSPPPLRSSTTKDVRSQDLYEV